MDRQGIKAQLQRITALDIISFFPRLCLSFQARKAELVDDVLNKASDQELTAALGIHQTQLKANQGISSPDAATGEGYGLEGAPDFPAAPTESDIRTAQSDFCARFTNEALRTVTCAICGRETPVKDAHQRRLDSLDRTLLRPITAHPDMVLFDGCLLDLAGITSAGTCNDNVMFHTCNSCEGGIRRGDRPEYSLARGTWVGDVPTELKNLTYAEELLIGLAKTTVQVIKLHPKGPSRGDPSTFQRGIRGTCSTYHHNIPEVVRMLEDKLLPLPPRIFSSTLSVAFIGKQRITKESLKSLFAVSRRRVYAALLWLQAHNPLYADISISSEVLAQLPYNDVPREILSLMRYSQDTTLLNAENTRYTDEDERAEDDTGKLLDLLAEYER